MPRFTSRTSRYRRRRPYRRPTRRTRIIRRRTITRRRPLRVTRRRILNVSSEKKSDARLPFTNVQAPGSLPSQTIPILSGGQTYTFIYIPTAMDKTPSTATDQDVGNYRSRTDVYMRGYRETVRARTQFGEGWIWRRIGFTFKGDSIWGNATSTLPVYLEASPNGWTRPVSNHTLQLTGNNLNDLIFKGTAGVDWSDVMQASLDTTKISVKYDKTMTITGRNGQPRFQYFKFWHGMNSNFYYDDEENGADETSRVTHTQGQQGMGDYYIVDFLECASTSSGITMEWLPQGRLYWHER